MNTLKIIKIGGHVVDNPTDLQLFLKDFASINTPKILVHGGGKIASAIGRSLGIEPQMIDGRRVTDPETLRVVTMVYGGLINKNIVAHLQSLNCNAIGLTGADGALIRSRRRPSTPIDFGEVGDPVSVNTSLISTLLSAGLIPIIAPLTLSTHHTILNTNADTIAQTIAVAMAKLYSVELLYTLELPGVLDKAKNLIPTITPLNFQTLKTNNTINGGMIPKIENALLALKQGVLCVKIGQTTIQ